jgi:hypothetical protein
MSRFKDGPIGDIIVLFLTFIIGLVVIISIITIAIVEIKNPEYNSDTEMSAIRDITGTMIAAVVGYIGGRNVNKE